MELTNTATLNFCTLFDSNFMVQGLAMYRSLEKYCTNFCLYVFCFDDTCYARLSSLYLSNVVLISLEEFENEALLSVKSSRTKQEYCWTTTPFTILHCIEQYNLASCIYLDADLLFFNTPQILIDEVPTGKSVLITEHRFSKKYASSYKYAGIFNVQYMYFKNTEGGMRVLHWWAERCIEWCYAYFEGGKIGDQGYLDDWPTRFGEDVHVLRHLGGGLAPWNEQQFRFYKKKNDYHAMKKSNNKIYEIVFYHFQSLKITNLSLVNYQKYYISKKNYNILYKTYVASLNNANKELNYNQKKITLWYYQVHLPVVKQSISEALYCINQKTLKAILFLMRLFGVHPIYKKLKNKIIQRKNKASLA